MEIAYRTRDGTGKDIVKMVAIKPFKEVPMQFTCPVCHREVQRGCRVRDIVSSNFTDWNLVGEFVCPECARLFSLYFYNYIVDDNGIRLLNVRELRDELIVPQKRVPYLFCITTTQKKHLFYRAEWNYTANPFCVNLETETIATTTDRMQELFDFVEGLQTLGAAKGGLLEGEIPFGVLQKTGAWPLAKLRHELQVSREIQIPLYCGQKREISEEEALCCISSTRTV